MPIRFIGIWQCGQCGGGKAAGAIKGGAFQSNNAKMRARRLLAAGASQPK